VYNIVYLCVFWCNRWCKSNINFGVGRQW
jgi:hypothetical protein